MHWERRPFEFVHKQSTCEEKCPFPKVKRADGDTRSVRPDLDFTPHTRARARGQRGSDTHARSQRIDQTTMGSCALPGQDRSVVVGAAEFSNLIGQ